MFLKKKIFNKKNNFLFFSCLFHAFSILCTSFLDYKNRDVHILSISNFLSLLTWWSFHASLISLINYLYLLVKNWREDSENRRNDSYLEQVFNLITANANIISMFLFLLSFIASLIFKGKRIIPVSRREKYFYWFYTTVWHILSPTLGIIYFSKVDFSLIEKFEEDSIFHSFFHPIFYFLFVTVRAANSNCIEKSKKYPYDFFLIAMNDNSNFFLRILFRFSFFFSFYLMFYFSSFLMLKINKYTKHNKLIIEKDCSMNF